MGQRRFVAMAGAIVVAIAGCSSEQTTTSSPSPAASSPTASSPAAPSPAASPTQSPAAQPFAKPLMAQKPAASGAVSGLIQPTNGDERAKQVQATINANKTRGNPFSPMSPVLLKPASAPLSLTGAQVAQAATNSVPTLPNAPQPGTLPTLTANGKPPRPSSPFPSRPGSSPSTSGKPPSSPNGTPTTPTPAAIPSPPSTTLASGVEVSGVVYIGGIAQAILKAPNEQTSRYVKVGQRLSDGQVLVKRIEMNSGSEPVVVLEQNGVEVPKVVGEQAPAAEKPA